MKGLNIFRFALAALFSVGVGHSISADATGRLQIERRIEHDPSKAMPVSITGFPPEIARVLAFDLEVAGCRIVSQAQAIYQVSGKYSGRLEGYLALGNEYPVAKAYQGADPRRLAHAFADDIALAINKVPGIARTRFLFKNRTRGLGEIYVADYDGNGVIPLTRDGSIVAAPTWGLNNTRIYYTSYRRHNPDIYAQDYATGKRTIVARYPGSNLTPVPSPDGTRVAMVLSKGGSPNLYVSDINGGNLRQITKIRAGVSTPTWSPDSRWICYTSREAGPARLFKIRADGYGKERISTVGAYNCTEPDWSPDGKYIAFTTQRGGFTLCIVPAAGGRVEQLVSGEDPSWAPNSRTIMFVKRRADQSYYLSLLDVPTKQVKDVPLSLGNASQPAWAR